MPRYAEVEKTVFELAKAFDEEISIQRDTRFSAYAHALGVKAQNIVLKNAVPKIDVKGVVHCRDCVYATYIHNYATNETSIFRCGFHKTSLTDENGFCSWARSIREISNCIKEK